MPRGPIGERRPADMIGNAVHISGSRMTVWICYRAFAAAAVTVCATASMTLMGSLVSSKSWTSTKRF
jgi:hypothetical protein